MNQVVRDRYVKGLIEIAQPFGRPQQYSRSQSGEER
jgi:hypothetical protein